MPRIDLSRVKHAQLYPSLACGRRFGWDASRAQSVARSKVSLPELFIQLLDGGAHREHRFKRGSLSRSKLVPEVFGTGPSAFLTSLDNRGANSACKRNMLKR